MPTPVPGSKLGIDVSHWQGAINWQEVGSTSSPHGNVEWAYAKASTGKTGSDPRFVENALGATAAGIPFGAYHWIRPGYNDPVDEADNFVSVIQSAIAQGAEVNLAPMIDLEEAPKEGWPVEAVISYLDTCCQRVKELTGMTPIVYVGSNYAAQYLGRSKLSWPIWVPQYNRVSCNYDAGTLNPNKLNATTENWSVWQICSKGTIPGIKGDVDLNVLRPGHEAAIFGTSLPGDGTTLALVAAVAAAVVWAAKKKRS